MKKLLCSLLFTVLTVSFVQAQADINIQGNSVDIVDGDTTPDIADDTDFGQVTIGSDIVKTFTIQNTGVSDLNLSGVGFSLGTNSQFSLDVSSTTSPIPGGNFTTFTVTFTPTVTGVVSGGLTISSDDPDAESTYTYNIQAEGVAASGDPDINIQGNSVDIVDGDTTPDLADHTDFGDTSIGSTLTRTFTIQNTGIGDLSLTGVGFGFGTNAQFSIDVASTTTPIPGSGSTTFTVTYTPTVAGSASGSILITSDDPDAESTYTYDIVANGVSAPDINIQGNSVDIADGDTTPSTADHTDFDQVTIGSNLTRTFTIQNTGSDDLVLGSVGLGFGTNAQFSIDVSSTTSPITGASSTTFVVTFTPTVAGAVTGSILITSNDPDAESTYTYSIAAEGIILTEPDINVQGNGIDILDGDTTPDVADDTDFGQVTVGATLTRTFTIQNTGNANLNLTSVGFGFGTNAQFSIDITGTTSPIVGLGSTTFDVTFTPTVAGTVSGSILITSDDPDAESSYTFNLAAEGVTANEPEMDVQGLGNSIASGDTTPSVTDDTDFGQTDIASGTVAHTFTILNTGDLDLNLTGADPFVVISGTNAADFTVTTAPSSTISAAGSTTFLITYNPSVIGVSTATLSIANNDADEDPYTFDLQGEGIDASIGSPLMISQYYEGTSSINNWIEVKKYF